MCFIKHLGTTTALKTQKLPGPLSGPWTPATNCSLRYIGNFQPQNLGTPHLDQILDPHLVASQMFNCSSLQYEFQ